jgi:cytochrome d ubiquinol oxidase subunit II
MYNDMSYLFLQHYWWFLVSLLGALLVFLMFVQGINSLLFQLGKTEDERSLLVNLTGRKWELTFTTLVTFGGGFFASFPLFYSTSFGGAYWLWMIILFTFVMQAVSYEFQSRLGNLLGKRTYQSLLVLNGIVAPLLVGGAVATFFTGSNFLVNKGNLLNEAMPVISSWANASHGLDALLNPWNVVLGLAVVFVARVLGIQYVMNRVDDAAILGRCRKQLVINVILFLVFFLAFMGYIFTMDGFAVSPATGEVYLEPYKNWHNLNGATLTLFIFGVGWTLFGLAFNFWGNKFFKDGYRIGIYHSGLGVVFVVLSLFFLAGYGNSPYYPSTADMQSSLTLSNSCASEFTLRTMTYVSFLIPFVLAYIIYAWRALEKKTVSVEEMAAETDKY